MNNNTSSSYLDASNDGIQYDYIHVFKNPNKLPINVIHLERKNYVLRQDIPNNLDVSDLPKNDKYFETKTEIIKALDKRWLPKCLLHKYEPYTFTLSQEENSIFLSRNILFVESMEYLLNCDFHQFWCTILFEPTSIISLRSYLLNPVMPYQSQCLKGQFFEIYNTVFNVFLLVYERLTTFKVSEIEYMSEDFGYRILMKKKLLSLPAVVTLAAIYKKTNVDFVNRITTLYFSDTSDLDFQIKEVEETICQTLIIFEMIRGYLCGFSKDAVIVPIGVKQRPPVFCLKWVYSVVNYLLHTIYFLNVLLEYYKPSIKICLDKELPFRLPSAYVSIYSGLYEMLDGREEVLFQPELSDMVFDQINLGRSEFVKCFQYFISYCLDKALEYMDDGKQQDQIVEIYLKLLNTALEDEYFICDYDNEYNVASQNEMFESFTSIDSTRTEFIVSCINKLARHKRLQQLCSLRRETIEDVFKKFKPPELEREVTEESCSAEDNHEKEKEAMIKDVMDMFPHLGDGFILACLEAYDYNKSEVINAILEENLMPHLYDIPFEKIRIPPDPEANKPMLAYTGKKPDYDDALKLLNDKKDIKKIKTFVLDGIHYSNDYLYDDEYDDRDYDHTPIKVKDNPLGEEEILSYNPNREDLASDTSYTSDDEYDDQGTPINKDAPPQKDNRSRMNFCEDPAVLRERRDQRYRSKHPPKNPQKADAVVGKPKGQGQDKNTQKARDKKNVNKSARANHNRKSGASWKRSRGMIPS